MSACAHRKSCKNTAVYVVQGPMRSVLVCSKHVESAKSWAWNKGRVKGHVKCWRVAYFDEGDQLELNLGATDGQA